MIKDPFGITNPANYLTAQGRAQFDDVASQAASTVNQARELIAGNRANLNREEATPPPKTVNINFAQEIKYENALKAAGLGDAFGYYFQIKRADSDGNVSTQSPTVVTAETGPFSAEELGKIVLDIPPSAISITSPFAISLTATNKGVLEEHNGLVFKTITISGNTGVLPRKKSKLKPPNLAQKLINNFFPETGQAVSNLIGNAQNAASFFGFKPSLDKPVLETEKNSGYGKFWRLHNLLVAYATIKKNPENKDLRLVFGSPKDNVEYVCAPISFEMRRDASRPLIYNYTIVLKSYQTTAPTTSDKIDLGIPSPRNPGIVKNLAALLGDARDVVEDARDVMNGINSDIGAFFNVVNQAVLFAKDLGGLAQDIKDFPGVVKNNYERTILGAVDQCNAAWAVVVGSGDDVPKRLLGSNASPFNQAALITVTPAAAAATSAATTSGKVNGSTGQSKTLGTESTSSAMTDAKKALAYILESPEASAEIPIDSIDYPDSILQQIQDQRDEAAALESGDIRDLQSDIQEASDNLAQSTGMMDAGYAQTYGLPAPVPGRAPTEDDIILMAALQQLKDGFGSLLATGEFFREIPPDPFEAANAGLPEEETVAAPNSAFLTRLNEGETLQTVAYRTLGSAERWREIAILNDLKPPYISSQTTSKIFSAPSGRTVLVSSANDLAIGLTVSLEGNFKSRRKIINIENLGSSYRITFDGQDNLALFLSSPVKKMVYAQPGTVVSGDPLLIPSNGASDLEEINRTRPTPLYSRLSHAEKIFKIDLAVTDTGDLKVGSNGDVVRSYGYDNAVQAIKLALTVQRGELERHPTYGIRLPIGLRNNDLSTTELNALVSEQVSSDPRFFSSQARVTIETGEENKAPAVRVEVVAVGAESTGLIPVEFRSGDVD